MIGPGGQPLTIYLAMRPVDFRKGHDGLSSLVQETFGRDLISGRWRDVVVRREIA